jgi:hypothetical protein
MSRGSPSGAFAQEPRMRHEGRHRAEHRIAAGARRRDRCGDHNRSGSGASDEFHVSPELVAQRGVEGVCDELPLLCRQLRRAGRDPKLHRLDKDAPVPAEIDVRVDVGPHARVGRLQPRDDVGLEKAAWLRGLGRLAGAAASGEEKRAAQGSGKRMLRRLVLLY